MKNNKGAPKSLGLLKHTLEDLEFGNESNNRSVEKFKFGIQIHAFKFG